MPNRNRSAGASVIAAVFAFVAILMADSSPGRAQGCAGVCQQFKVDIGVSYTGYITSEDNGDNPALDPASTTVSYGDAPSQTPVTGTVVDDDLNGIGSIPISNGQLVMQSCKPYTITATGSGGVDEVDDGYEPAGYSFLQLTIHGCKCYHVYVDDQEVISTDDGTYTTTFQGTSHSWSIQLKPGDANSCDGGKPGDGGPPSPNTGGNDGGGGGGGSFGGGGGPGPVKGYSSTFSLGSDGAGKPAGYITWSVATITADTFFPWGTAQIASVLNPDGAARTTTWNFYQDPNDASNYSRLQAVQNGDGSWSQYAYGALGIVAKSRGSWKAGKGSWVDCRSHPTEERPNGCG